MAGNQRTAIKITGVFCYLVSSLSTGKSISLQAFFHVLKNRLVHFVCETLLSLVIVIPRFYSVCFIRIL